MDKNSWQLSELDTITRNGYKVFSCFCGGGGSSMGYKLAGYDVIGGVEIDPAMMKLYQLNLKPRYSFTMSINEFNQIPDKELPAELFKLDVLDGSPPCSSFSIAGVRERKWGKKSAFREGQSQQILDDLFFQFIDTARKLKPKIVIAENVKGLVIGKARGYVKQIVTCFKNAGYDTQLFLLNSALMGVPQKRQRVFFIARRNELKLPEISLNFNEPVITVNVAFKGINQQNYSNDKIKWLTANTKILWQKTKPGNSLATVHKNGSRFNEKKLSFDKPATTLTTHCTPLHPLLPRRITLSEAIRLQTFPDDYDFANTSGFYAVGMSVPPFMLQRIALNVQKQLLDNR